jgi:hypothetical protein
MMNPLANFKWYRRMRGGRWATVCGMVWGRRWIRLPDACVERAEEDWRELPSVFAELLREKERRVGYQGIVYACCLIVERATGRRHLQVAELTTELRKALAHREDHP